MAGIPPQGPPFHPMLGPRSVSGRPFDPWQSSEQGDPAPFTQVIVLTDAGASDDGLITVSLAEFPVTGDLGGATDGISVFKLPVPPMGVLVTPGTATFPGPHSGPASGQVHPSDARPPKALAVASPAFVRSQMPVMHVENLLTGQWLHRDVQGIGSPSVTWMLNGADTFTHTISPPQLALLDPTGNPLFNEWQAACYLEERDEIKFGGILTGSTFQGPQWTLTWTGFAGYPSGMPYEGPAYSQVGIDALDVVRYIWGWIQAQPGGNLGLILDNTKASSLLGAQTNPSNLSTRLAGGWDKGSQYVKVRTDARQAGFRANMSIQIGDETCTIRLIGTGPGQNTHFVVLKKPLAHWHPDGTVFKQSPIPVPFTLDWWNSVDLGQEIASIQQEAVFDYREQHQWSDPQKNRARHNLRFGAPRIGIRQSGLRFIEGENIILPVQGTRDGTRYFNHVVGMGAGQGRTTIRSEAAEANSGRLRRVTVYQDQTVRRVPRMTSKARRVLSSVQRLDTYSQAVVKNHPHAEFGTFGPGDDILVTAVTGWRNAGIWHRITQMQQDPTTDTMTLTLARSDSFTYLAQSGQAGTL